ncbi:MAG: response regulator transcription factor [Candidatus Omnitrophica bacterium]|nr:response regulator transcription factor [Candidatus Omnitrophota bacterium]
MSIKIILADDHNIVREAIGVLLDSESDMKVVGESADGRTTLELAQKMNPDVVVTDIAMPGLNGIGTTRKIIAKMPGVKVIALSAYSDRKFVFHMFKAGASGYLLKDCVFDELTCAIRAVVRNEIYISPRIANIVVKDFIHQSFKNDSLVFYALTDREREVLQLLAEGKATKQVAFLLKISPKTIETHRLNIMEKLNIHSVPELTKYAIREGLTFL